MGSPVVTPRGTVTIRSAAVEDASAFRDLRLQALRDHPEAFSADYNASLAEPMQYWADRLRPGKDTTGAIFFAVHEQQLVGMCGIVRRNSPKIRHSALIWGMYVWPEWRGSRIADALVNACLDWVRPLGVTIVNLAVVTTNVRAIRCYARCGFQVYGIESQAIFYNNVYYDELMMAKKV